MDEHNSLSKLGNSSPSKLIRKVKPYNSVIHSNDSIDSSINGSRQDLNFSLPRMNGTLKEGAINPRRNKLPWGFEGYKAPTTITSATFSPKGGKFNKTKLISFIDEVQADKSKLPPAFKYTHVQDWTKIVKGNKGKFLKDKKKTIIADIADRKAALPDPTKYDNSPVKANLSTVRNAKKGALGIIGKEAKRCGFYDEALEEAGRSPSHIYKTDVSPVKPKILGTTIYKGKDFRVEPLTRKPSPAPGLYDTQAAFSKTQIKFSNIKFGRTKKEGFFEEVERASKRVPGVGTYKQIDFAYDKLSRSPKAIRSPRK